MLKIVAYCTPYKASICQSAADNWEAGVCCVHVDEMTEKRQTMEGTAGADGTDVACTRGGGVGMEASIMEASITLQQTCLYVGFTAGNVMIVLIILQLMHS